MPEDRRHQAEAGAHQEHAPRQPLHEEVQFDENEVSIIGVVVVLAAIFGRFLFLGGVAAWYLWEEATLHPESDTGSYSQPSAALPAKPRLEPLSSGTGELSSNVFRRQLFMEKLLHGYGRTSDANFVRIPIELAIKYLATHAESDYTQRDDLNESFGLVGGGEANSGRLYEEAPSWFATPR